MLSLDELLHPITPESFAADYQGRKPLHIPAVEGSARRDLLTWDAFNALLNQGALWTANNLRLMQDAKPVPPEQYCRPTQGTLGRVMRPSPAKVAVFLSGGASLIAGEVVTLHPPIADLSVTLARAFAGEIGANVYCSFKGVQAFGTHYDLHDVFAVQTEGEKVWRLYDNCAVLPVDPLPHTPETQRYFEQNRGRVMTEVRMRPGDVLYLPRGWYHDALAEDGPVPACDPVGVAPQRPHHPVAAGSPGDAGAAVPPVFPARRPGRRPRSCRPSRPAGPGPRRPRRQSGAAGGGGHGSGADRAPTRRLRPARPRPP